MSDIEILKRNIESLENLAIEIENNVNQLFTSGNFSSYNERSRKIEPFQSPLKELHRETIRKYQSWYSVALTLISDNIPEKEKEFTSLYEKPGYWGGEGVFDLVRFDRSFPIDKDEKSFIQLFSERFEIQRSILLSVPDVFSIKEMNLREIISAAFVEREIDQAEYLYDKKFYRCAGALAGVALEQHLRVLCDKYQLNYKKKDTIEPLVRMLYENKKIEIEEMKNIQHLATIRDLCDHASDIEPTKVKELIERVKKMS